MWAAPGLLVEGNPFAVYFGEEIRRSRPLARQRVVTIAKCWLVAAYVEYRMAPDLAREIERLDPADATVANALGGAENVRTCSCLLPYTIMSHGSCCRAGCAGLAGESPPRLLSWAAASTYGLARGSERSSATNTWWISPRSSSGGGCRVATQRYVDAKGPAHGRNRLRLRGELAAQYRGGQPPWKWADQFRFDWTEAYPCQRGCCPCLRA